MPSTNYLEQAVLETIYAGTDLSFGTVFGGLYTSAPGDFGGGTEVSGNGYSRVPIPPASPVGGAVFNTLDIVWPTPSGSWGTVVAFGVFDAVTGGNLLLYDSFSGQAVSAGQSVSIAAFGLLTTME